MIKKLCILLVALSLMNCDTEDDISDSVLNVRLLKSRAPASGNNFYTSSYEYDNSGRLIKAEGYTGHQSGSYSYDNTGRLSQIENEYVIITFTYDSQNRLILEEHVENDGTLRTVTFTYEGNNVYRNRTYTTINGIVIEEEYNLVMNDQGQIIKSIYQNQSSFPSEEGTVTEDYEYDSRGNLIKIEKQLPYENEPRVQSISYDNNPNPFYYALKSAHRYTLLSITFLGSGLEDYNTFGFSPNNKNLQDFYEYNSEGLPVIWDTGNTTWIMEYFN